MKSTIFFSIVVIAFLSLSLYAEEMPVVRADQPGETQTIDDSPAMRLRSKPDSMFWVHVFGGVEGGSWGINSGGGAGIRHGLGARLQIQRCSIVGEWTREELIYYQPDPSSELNIFGVGVSCRLKNFGQKHKFWRGAHFLPHIMAEYGSNKYDLYDRNDHYFTSGKTWGWGTNLGIDFMMPVFFGFWGFGGTGLELLKFNYDVPANSLGIRDNGAPTLNVFVRVGIAYGI